MAYSCTALMEARTGLPAAEDCEIQSSSLLLWVRDRRTVRTETVARAGRREVCQWCNYATVYAIHQRVLALHRSRGNLLPGGQVLVPQRRDLEPEPWSSTQLRNSRQRYSYVDSNSGYRSIMFGSSAAVVYECETGSFVLRKENTVCRGFWIFGM